MRMRNGYLAAVYWRTLEPSREWDRKCFEPKVYEGVENEKGLSYGCMVVGECAAK